MDIAAWLNSLGMQQYEAAFRDNAVDAAILPELTAEDLKDLGVSLVGHRRRLLAAIAALRREEDPASKPVAPSPAAERRQLTVMFSDLVGSTPLSARYDPEDLREMIGAYHRCVAETVGRFGGFVAKYMGDGVLIYFGYPEAHEDDAERALRAGLAIIEEVGGLATPERLNVRLGVATGLVVVGDLLGAGSAQEQTVVGETPNLAARLQALAAANTILIGERTRQVIGGLFELEDLGPKSLAGFAEPQRVWRVLRESRVLSRFEALRSAATPLVGRDEEIELLLRRWGQAQAGEGRVMLIPGEPGIGKSRLTAALSERIRGKPHTRLRYFCLPHHQNSALHPFITQLERAAGFTREDAAAAKLEKLQHLLAPLAPAGDEAELIAELLSLPNLTAELNLSPRRKREMLFEALLHRFEALTRTGPVLMVFEDAHWIDPTSRELLDLTVEHVRGLPVLLIVTFRPEFQPPWTGQPRVSMLALNRLGGQEGAILVARLAGNAGLSPETISEIVERADGVPLFVEELTKAVLESDDRNAALAARPAPALSVPATLHASLIARLDRLGAVAKEVGQIGAVLGREFGYELIQPIAQSSEADLQAALAQLTDAGLLFCRGVAPQSTYLFNHALVQDAAYGTLLRDRRQQYHERAAKLLEDRFPELASTQPELVAHHYTEAGRPAPAIAYWLKAGMAAAAKSANIEAIEQFGRGLSLVDALPDPRERAERELDLQMALGPALFATKGWTHHDIGRTYARARELCQQLDDYSREFTVLRGLFIRHLNLHEMEQTQHFAEEALRVAELLGDAARLVGAHAALGSTLYYQGKLEPAVPHYRRGVELFDPNMQFPDWPGTHPGVTCQFFLAVISWMLGYPDRALSEARAAIQSAETLGHPLSLCQTLCWAAFVHIFRREPSAAGDCAERVLKICEEQSIAQYQALALCQSGWVLAISRERERGLAQIAQGLASYAGISQQKLFALQADAQLALGKPEAVLESVAAGLKSVERMGGASLEAELHRLRGEALLAGAETASEAETAIEKSIAVARRQNAKSWELRGAMSLARLRRDQGRRAEARDLLASVYDWFTEGFDTADLSDAAKLLAELA